ncbi:Protein transport protein BET1 [Kluyveromyces marxianus]|uniref:Protein transport protein BET1 n=2 Tax=Kluyveromyces marxianus TaxID=4911 RepID=W0TDB0_KLUMD|nr:protein transport protein BET1 [Kluyveromyces marxianus DMKU3-1042]QGN16768.1 protein transport protein BET1 [Kluyveromyces marxianus]BAO41048.1 protein transport protein BET1 [Kluyveromyces marxianus DMKU3-1042]BAP72510.1 protein transport protein BET1 [Kluyveromyces marxianus]
MSSNYGGFQGDLTQRDASRTQLFDGADFSKYQQRQQKPTSSFEKSSSGIDYSQATLSQLESQSDEQMNMMSQKIHALKSLSLRMGDEIRGSNQTLDQLGNVFEQTTNRLKRTFKNMMVMAQKSGVSIKTWLIIFGGLTLLFFYIWIR